MSRPIRVGITHGDYNGIGYEIIVKALADERITELCTPVIFGSKSLAEQARIQFAPEEFSFTTVEVAADADDGRINLVDVTDEEPELQPGVPTPESGNAAVVALDAATQALRDGDIDVLVTAPICKENAHNDETFPYPGHTEYLEDVLGDGAKALMILFSDEMRVALLTTHLPISAVAAAVTQERIIDTVTQLNDTLRRDFAIDGPRIAVLALNPHAGDGGLLGSEEQEIIIPAVEECRRNGILAFGPKAADGFFGSGMWRNFDGIVAMYHDQGLAPFKMVAGSAGVNFTASLPFIRTSPDHGTAFDIAWKGKADETSMRQAIYNALDLYRHRAIYNRASRSPLRRHYTEKGADKTVDLTKETDD